MTMNESMLRAALSLISDAIFVIDVETMLYIEFNDATCRMAGRTREELARIGPLGIWTQTGGSPEGLRQHYDAMVAQAPAQMNHVAVVHRPDGTFIRVWMEREARRIEGRWVVLARARELQDGDEGDPLYPKASDVPAPTLNSLRAAMQASQDAVSIIDFQGMRYLDLNAAACEVLGYSRDELLEGDLPLSGDRTLEDMRQIYSDLILQSPKPTTETGSFMRSDGTVIPGIITRKAVLADGMWMIYVSVKRTPA